jgi:hypothetical protein
VWPATTLRRRTEPAQLSQFVNSTLKMATMAITGTDLVAEATATNEDSVVEADSQTNLDKTESATAGLTERVSTK